MEKYEINNTISLFTVLLSLLSMDTVAKKDKQKKKHEQQPMLEKLMNSAKFTLN